MGDLLLSLLAGGTNRVQIEEINSTPYLLRASDYIIHVTYTLIAPATIIIPSVLIAQEGRICVVKDGGLNASTNNITIETEGAETIEGEVDFVLIANGESISIYSDGSNLFIY